MINVENPEVGDEIALCNSILTLDSEISNIGDFEDL